MASKGKNFTIRIRGADGKYKTLRGPDGKPLGSSNEPIRNTRNPSMTAEEIIASHHVQIDNIVSWRSKINNWLYVDTVIVVVYPIYKHGSDPSEASFSPGWVETAGGCKLMDGRYAVEDQTKSEFPFNTDEGIGGWFAGIRKMGDES